MLVWLVGMSLPCHAHVGISLFVRAVAIHNSPSPDDAIGMFIFGVIMLILTLIFSLIVYSIRVQIAISIEVVREASKAIAHIPSLYLFPILPFLGTMGYITFWVIVALYIYSVANLVERDTDTRVLYDAVVSDMLNGGVHVM